MPKISVIMPAFNSECYIGAAIDSILAQTFSDLELIIINDGSTDLTGSIIENYLKKDKRIRVFHKENSGVADSRNFAMKMAQGEWLAFCDSDDTLPRTAYESMILQCENADIVVSNFYDIDDYNNKLPSEIKEKNYHNDIELLLSVVCVWNKLFRKSYIIESNVLFPSVQLGEDAIFLAQLSTFMPRYAFNSDYVYFHWHHNRDQEASLTHQYNLEMFKQHIYCREKILRICGEAAEKLVYFKMSRSLVVFLTQIDNIDEKYKAFYVLRDFVLKYDWNNNEQRFFSCFYVDVTKFKLVDAKEYFLIIERVSKLKLVLIRLKLNDLNIKSIFRIFIKNIKTAIRSNKKPEELK